MINPKLKEMEDTWFLDVTMDELQVKMNAGEITSKELVLLF
ncbi:hypothetical protein [Halalkalibacter krulwichiae]|uniref:Uncharacterized protein n=1 Tax=Halalkalibacter krulwichiae TaxID=199441 RepID=A0A1X9M696_9BACI|nr:hypothetical protein [Halalkalibacter krulwichiae]ARK28966.1 hypothetical protein BkAM31D_03315 [Halalkalibacter krulwichiae]